MSIKRSALVVPISIVVHLTIINGVLLLLTPDTYLQGPNALYYNFAWFFITNAVEYYPTKRKENFFTNINKMFNVYTLFGLVYFAIFGFGTGRTLSVLFHLKILFFIFILLTLYRVLFYWGLAKYRFNGR